MRTCLRFASAALAVGLFSFTPAFAQESKREQAEAELKKAKDHLEKLLRELKDRDAKPAAPKPAPPAPAKPMIAWTAMPPGGDAITALKGLTASKDPKVAALAKELLSQLLKSTPQPGKPIELQFEISPQVKPAGVFELKLQPLVGEEAPKVERRVVVMDIEKPGAPTPGTSSLKLSADGKTAAVLAADGTITIFDTASGKEIMKFAGKK